MKRLFIIVFFFSSSIISLFAQQRKVVTNEMVISYVTAGFDSDVIINKMAISEIEFDISNDGLMNLKSNNVPENIVKAMIAHQHKMKCIESGEFHILNTMDSHSDSLITLVLTENGLVDRLDNSKSYITINFPGKTKANIYKSILSKLGTLKETLYSIGSVNKIEGESIIIDVMAPIEFSNWDNLERTEELLLRYETSFKFVDNSVEISVFNIVIGDYFGKDVEFVELCGIPYRLGFNTIFDEDGDLREFPYAITLKSGIENYFNEQLRYIQSR